MIKKLIHLGDTHIRTFKYHDEYKEVLTNLINQAKELVKDFSREEVRIVHCGDIFHSKNNITNEQILFGAWFLEELEKIAPVVIIAGNHDLTESNLQRVDSITPLVTLLKHLDIKYLKESKCYLDDNIVWCCYSIFEQNQRPDIETYKLEFGLDKTYVGLFHGALVGSVTDIGYKFEHGGDLEIFEGCNMVCLADIHKLQSFKHKDINISYSSSFPQQNYGESIQNHGFLLWDVEKKDFEFHEVENPYKYYQFKIKSLDDIENDKEVLINK